jgi:hypothetical protein
LSAARNGLAVARFGVNKNRQRPEVTDERLTVLEKNGRVKLLASLVYRRGLGLGALC